LDHNPQIVHFSGHGVGEQGLLLKSPTGKIQAVSGLALARLFKAFQRSVNCVVLNACYSEVQAAAIHEHIPYVVGINAAIGDSYG
jgi:CHAT domain